MRLRQPRVKRQHPRLGAEAEEREMEGHSRPRRLQLSGVQRVERVVAAAPVQNAEAKQDRDRSQMRDQKIEEPRAADRRLLVVGGDQKIRRERHRCPGDHEEICVVGEQDDGHAREENVVLQADEREASRGLVAEITGGVHGDAGRDRTEQHQEKSRERVDTQMEGQIGQPERQRQDLRGQPHRLQSERSEGDSGGRAQRKGDSSREKCVVRRGQPQHGHREPADRDEQRACEGRRQDAHSYFTFIPGCAPLSGERRNRPGPSPEAASTIPSETPNFILRGAMFATITVNRPSSVAGSYADLMPANTVRVPLPVSSVSFKSLSAPSTYSALTILAMRRSSLLKSSMEMTPSPAAAGEGWDEGVIMVVSLLTSNKASSCFSSTRVMRCEYLLIWCPTDSWDFTSFQTSGGIFRNCSASFAR